MELDFRFSFADVLFSMNLISITWYFVTSLISFLEPDEVGWSVTGKICRANWS